MAGSFDVIVVGAGHAGCEAAAAAARMGARVAVLTLDRRAVAEMPCNPAMGGIGKGHLIAELDALGGIQGWATDRAGIHFRMLNRSRGPAVWGPRAQCDKRKYSRLMRRLLEGLPLLSLMEGEAVALKESGGRVVGVLLADGARLSSQAVVVTTGTFLSGVLHTGGERGPGGRYGERPSVELGEDLRRLGLKLRRFKTGTPARVHRDSIDYSRMEIQPGDSSPRPFSFRTRAVRNAISCWLTRTPPEVQEIISENLHRAPLFTGQIEGTGPRYCPSIEDKVVRFPHHREHTVFVEPEGVDSESVYLNGLSTSLPRDVQERVVRAVPGLGAARFLRHGYAVEYDVLAPGQVDRTLAVRNVAGLFLAGQVLGTSGYEEAAAQGFVAGVNAVLVQRGAAPLVIGRDQGYLGVLVDDVATREHREPYRMLTSRAEHRLALGIDSARERLMDVGLRLGLVSARAFHVEQERWQARDRAARVLLDRRLVPDVETRERVRVLAGVELRAPSTWAAILSREGVDAEAVAREVEGLAELSEEDLRIVLGRVRYAGYLVRHHREQERLARAREATIPEGFEYSSVCGLSREVVETLERERPTSLAEAEHLAAITPASLALLAGHLAGRGEYRGI